MELIIGGAYQGKLAYAESRHPELTWVDGVSCSLEEICHAGGVCHFHEFVKRQVKEGQSLDGLAEKIWEENPDLVLVSDEVGYGVVPVDSFDRAWREAVGRVSTRLAARSETVIRVVCGIGTVIKGD